jgi:excinuclease ABC subunit C
MDHDRRTLDDEVRAFVDAHPHGWGHGAWESFLGHLASAGHALEDTRALGDALERERLARWLATSGVKGLGPKRRAALLERFPRMWELRHATLDDIAELPSLNRSVAQALKDALA